MRRVLALVGVLAVIGAALAIPAFADTEGTVTATVTAGVVAISLSTTTAAYGTVALGSEDNAPTPSSFTVTNNGNVDADFGVKGANTANWTLGTGLPSGTDTYRHRASSNDFSTEDIARLAGIPRWLARKMAYCLRKTGATTIAGKRGNSVLYRADTVGEAAA